MTQAARKDRLVQQERRNPYQEKGKLPETSRCTECNAVFEHGRWSWAEAKGKAHITVCPACRRIGDGVPAGFVAIHGDFVKLVREELVGLLRNTEAKEKGEHPMERIMSRSDQDGKINITTTGVHLARRMGDAMKHAYNGELSLKYAEDETQVRISWIR